MRRALQHVLVDTRGVVAIEFAFLATTLLVIALNGVEIGTWYFQKMQVENAAQMAAQTSWKTCDTTQLPATTNCSGLDAALTSALQSTTLGTGVTQASGSPTEGWYCTSTAGALTYVSAIASKPANCGSVGSAADQPGDYIKITAKYTYVPLTTTISIGGSLPTAITSTTYMRLK